MLRPFRPGVLSNEQLWKLVQDEVIRNYPGTENDIDPSALDLHLSNKVYTMRGGIKGTTDASYSEVLIEYKEDENDLNANSGFRLEKNKTYVIKLVEELKLSRNLPYFGFATGKSSIGRLDVLTRLISDHSPYYDELLNPYDQDNERIVKLYVEVTPITFDILVYSGISLNQLRLYCGPPSLSLLTKNQIRHYGPVIFNEDGTNLDPNDDSYFHLSVNLEPTIIHNDKNASVFRANTESDLVIDLKLDADKIKPDDNWKLELKDENNTFEIKPNDFYIIRSKERFKLPSDIAVYAHAIAESLGELRIHYAGFVHPYFGFTREGGSPLIFEIQGHNVHTFLRHGEVLAKLQYYRLSQPAVKDDEPSYQEQELKLSKHFKDWE